MTNWNKIPLALRIGVILEVLTTALRLYLSHTHFHGNTLEKVWLAELGLALVIAGFLIVGTLELSTMLAGRAALGARLAAWGLGLSIALMVINLVLRAKDPYHERFDWLVWVWFAVRLAIAVGFTLAASRRWVIAVIALVAWLVLVDRAPPLDKMFVAWFDKDYELLGTIRTLLDLTYPVLVLVLAWVSIGTAPTLFADPGRVKVGLNRMSSALWLRVLAIALLPVLTIFLVMGDGHSGIEEMLGWATLLACAVNAISLTWFGFGALEVARSHVAEVGRAAFMIAAAASLWCAGVLLHQVPDLYRLIHHDSSRYGSSENSFATMFPILSLVVATTAIIAGALAISGYARRRDNLELSGRCERTAVLVGAMQLLSLGTVTYLLPEVRSLSGLLLITVMALIFGLVALVNPARLMRDAAGSIEDAPPAIPSAQLL